MPAVKLLCTKRNPRMDLFLYITRRFALRVYGLLIVHRMCTSKSYYACSCSCRQKPKNMDVFWFLITFSYQTHNPLLFATGRTVGIFLLSSLARSRAHSPFRTSNIRASGASYPCLPDTSTRPGRRGCHLRRLCLPGLPCFWCSACLLLPFLRCRPGVPGA